MAALKIICTIPDSTSIIVSSNNCIFIESSKTAPVHTCSYSRFCSLLEIRRNRQSKFVHPFIMVGNSGKRPARRCLFGPVSHVDVDDFLSSLDMHNEVIAMEKWGFDFRAGRPLPGIHRYDWTPLIGAEQGSAANNDLVSQNNSMGAIEDAQASASVEELASELASACVNSSSVEAGSDSILSPKELSEGVPDMNADSTLSCNFSSVGGSVQANNKIEPRS